jgi:hypothetical protein
MFSLFILRMIMHFQYVQVKKMECVYNIKDKRSTWDVPVHHAITNM